MRRGGIGIFGGVVVVGVAVVDGGCIVVVVVVGGFGAESVRALAVMGCRRMGFGLDWDSSWADCAFASSAIGRGLVVAAVGRARVVGRRVAVVVIVIARCEVGAAAVAAALAGGMGYGVAVVGRRSSGWVWADLVVGAALVLTWWSCLDVDRPGREK